MREIILWFKSINLSMTMDQVFQSTRGVNKTQLHILLDYWYDRVINCKLL